MYCKKGTPKQGELVLCKPKKILAHSAFLKLTEYENLDAYVHISQVSDGWVKSINDHVKKDAEIVCRVIRKTDRIEVSLKQVSKEAANNKLNESRSEKKAINIINAVAKKIGKTEKELGDELVKPVMEEYGSIHAFIELLKQEGDLILEELKIPKHWKNPILEYATETIKKVDLKQEIELYTFEPEGLEIIKTILTKFEKKGIIVKYIATPKYLLQITSKNYKNAQKKIDAILEELKKECVKQNVTLSYEKK
ncbi:MAG: hypothetical protein GON13_03345 [Nanoarchaeota archaeon]|nr:hypothetical protein [Nanoarchaeota archaeon]